MSEHDSSTAAGLSGLQKTAIVVFLLLFVGSVAARALLGEAPEEIASTGQTTPEGAQGFRAPQEHLAAGDAQAAEEPKGFESYLPYLTEGSLFALIGFALGYTTRKVFRLALILIALGFVGIQAAVWAGWVQVDWGGVVDVLNGWVLNLKENESLTEFLTRHVPAAGALVLGAAVGFRRA